VAAAKAKLVVTLCVWPYESAGHLLLRLHACIHLVLNTLSNTGPVKFWFSELCLFSSRCDANQS
jgi:hypothetical protein